MPLTWILGLFPLSLQCQDCADPQYEKRRRNCIFRPVISIFDLLLPGSIMAAPAFWLLIFEGFRPYVFPSRFSKATPTRTPSSTRTWTNPSWPDSSSSTQSTGTSIRACAWKLLDAKVRSSNGASVASVTKMTSERMEVDIYRASD